MDVIVTNFQGSLDEPCGYCEKPHRAHLVKLCAPDGEVHWHHEPCEAQIRALKQVRAPVTGLIPRLLRSLFAQRAA